MSLQGLLLVLVCVFAIIALLGKASIDPWWGVLALAIIMAIGAFGFYPRRTV